MLANVKELCIISELGKATNFLASSNQNELEVRMTDLPNTKLIPLTQGKFAIVDAEDYDWLMQWPWHANIIKGGLIYVRSKVNGYLHRLIMKAERHQFIDHINGNTLDNRKCNLRLCNKSDNARNTGIRKTNTSGYKGVSKCGNAWLMRIKIEDKRICKSFNSAYDAAIAYDLLATQYHGKFAKTNKSLGLLNNEADLIETIEGK